VEGQVEIVSRDFRQRSVTVFCLNNIETAASKRATQDGPVIG